MKKYLLIILLVSSVFGQSINPCEDERFIKISEKFVDQMTEIEYQYFLKKQKECAEYDKDNPILKSLKNNPIKVEKINLLEKLSFIFQHSSLLVIAFIILITSEITVRYSGISFQHTTIYYLLPMALLPFVYIFLIRTFKYENLN